MVFKLKKNARSSSSSSSPAQDWASLPEELLELILHRINQLSGYLRFAAVCKPWLLAANHQKDHRRREIHKQVVPMLLIHSSDQKTEAKEAVDDCRRLYSITKNKILSSLELRVPYRKRCCGSSHGWLATVNEEDLGITLLNPFSGRTLSLPKLCRLPYYTDLAMRDSAKYEYDVKKVILSCGDPSSEEFVVVAIHTMFNELAYIKPGRSKHWTCLEGAFYSDAIYHKGRFYVLDNCSGVLSLDVRDYSQPKGRWVVKRTTREHPYKAYIVVLSTGKDLLLVERFLKKKRKPSRWVTSSFKIFKLGFVSGSGISISGGNRQIAKVWIEIDSLGDDALFLGDNYSLSVSASNFPGCQANCVYYTDDVYIETCAPWYPYGPRDTGIYSFVDGRLAPHYEFKRKQIEVPMPPPIWIVPTLL